VADERPTATASTAVEVLPGTRSRIATLSGLLQVAGPFPKLRRLSWDAHVDLDRWWGGQPAAIEATVEHRWARAKVTAQATTVGRRWTVRCDAPRPGPLLGAPDGGRRPPHLARRAGARVPQGARRGRPGLDETLAHWQDAPPHDAARALLAALVTALVEPVSTE
jgi:hypothetical protein